MNSTRNVSQLQVYDRITVAYHTIVKRGTPKNIINEKELNFKFIQNQTLRKVRKLDHHNVVLPPKNINMISNS